MGGEHSSVTDDTTDVFLEIAWFTPERIARTGQALGLTSDARTRFERGADPAFLDAGLDLVTRLILDICGGEASEAVRVGEPPIEQRVDRLRLCPHRRARRGRRGRERAGRDPRAARLRSRRLARHRPDLAPRRRWSRRPGRGSRRASPAMTRSSSTAARAAPGCRQADGDARADDRAQDAPSRRRARAQRGGDLELHRRGRSRAVRGRRFIASPTRSART